MEGKTKAKGRDTAGFEGEVQSIGKEAAAPAIAVGYQSPRHDCRIRVMPMT